MEKFILAGPAGINDVPGEEGADPAGTIKVETPGIYLAGFRSKRKTIELSPQNFESYLRHEGLERIIALRAQRGESDKPGREVYSRAAKALIRAGDASEAGFDRRLDFTLELVLMKNPFALQAGRDELPVLVLHNGKPIEGIEVFAMSQNQPESLHQVRSDSEGIAKFKLPGAGVWMIKAIHMLPAPPGLEADWESIWATLTFEIQGPRR
jgi:uncharacterized GH25 family protein